MIRIGRRKLIVPLYRDLAATPDGLALAKKIFAKARDGYHPLAQTTVAEILQEGPYVLGPSLVLRPSFVLGPVLGV